MENRGDDGAWNWHGKESSVQPACGRERRDVWSVLAWRQSATPAFGVTFPGCDGTESACPLRKRSPRQPYLSRPPSFLSYFLFLPNYTLHQPSSATLSSTTANHRINDRCDVHYASQAPLLDPHHLNPTSPPLPTAPPTLRPFVPQQHWSAGLKPLQIPRTTSIN